MGYIKRADNKYVGYVEKNYVYNMSTPSYSIGVIDNRYVYKIDTIGRECVGFVEGDNIYKMNGIGNDLVGSFKGGNVYYYNGYTKELTGSCSNAYEAAALILLLNADNITTESSNNKQDTSNGYLMTIGFVLINILIAAIVLLLPILIWPIIFSKSIQETPGASLYTIITILSIIFGLVLTAKTKRNLPYMNFLSRVTVYGGTLMAISVYMTDSQHIANIGYLLLPFALVLIASVIPAFIVWKFFYK